MLPFDSMRLDRRWANGLGREPRVRDALGALCALARSASLATIVDGIDDGDALAALAGLDVDCVQGELVDAAGSVSDARALARAA